jgi:hypothetical protein
MHPAVWLVLLAVAMTLVQRLIEAFGHEDAADSAGGFGGDSEGVRRLEQVCVVLVAQPSEDVTAFIHHAQRAAAHPRRVRFVVHKAFTRGEPSLALDADARVATRVTECRRTGFCAARERVRAALEVSSAARYLLFVSGDQTMRGGWDASLIDALRLAAGGSGGGAGAARRRILLTTRPAPPDGAPRFPRLRGNGEIEWTTFATDSRRPVRILTWTSQLSFCESATWAAALAAPMVVDDDDEDAAGTRALWLGGCDFYAPPCGVTTVSDGGAGAAPPSSWKRTGASSGQRGDVRGDVRGGSARSCAEHSAFLGVSATGVTRRARCGLMPNASVAECRAKYGCERVV